MGESDGAALNAASDHEMGEACFDGACVCSETRRIDDVQVILDALIGREPTENEWENVPYLAALRRIEQTLEGEGYA